MSETLRQITFRELDALDVGLTRLSAYASGWPDGTVTRHERDGRPDNMLFYLTNGRWVYKVNAQEHFIANNHDILYIPSGCRYESLCQMPERGARSTGICLKFTLRDADGAEIAVGDKPLILIQDPGEQFRPYFDQALQAILRGTGGKMLAKSLVLRLLDALAASRHREDFSAGSYKMIYPAIRQLDLYPGQDISVRELANLCFLSESTFRRKFRQYAGMCPLAYRNAIRIRKADELLASGLYTVEAAAEVLGFTDASHFYKTYRRLRDGLPKH